MVQPVEMPGGLPKREPHLHCHADLRSRMFLLGGRGLNLRAHNHANESNECPCTSCNPSCMS